MINIPNTNNWLSSQAEKIPKQTIIISDDKVITFDELENEVSVIANHLQTMDIHEGDKIALLSENDTEFIKMVLALWKLHAIPVPLSIRSALKEILRNMKFSNSKLLLINHKFSRVYTDLTGINKFSFPFTNIETKHLSTVNLIFNPGNTALILFTSGTESDPKAVILTFNNLFYSAQAVDSIVNHTSTDTWLASLPFYHIGGFSIIARAILSGCKIILPKSLKTDDIIGAMESQNPSLISLVPTMLKRIIDSGIKPNKNLRFLFLGGSPADPDLILKAINLGWPISTVYGSTETSSMVTAILTEELNTKPASSGKALFNNKIEIIGECNRVLPSNKSGEIVVMSNSITKGYYNDEDLSAKRINGERYFTGDAGYLDNEGYLFVEARREDQIISGGENIYLEEIEKVIESVPVVKEVTAFGMDDKDWGQILVAAIVKQEGSDLDEDNLIQFLRKYISAYKIPKKIIFLDELPKSDLGKIKKEKIRKLFD